MPKLNIITGLDIGTSSIKVLAVSRSQDNEIQVLGQAQEPCMGVRRGVVVEPEEVAAKISLAIQRVEAAISEKITNVNVNISGSHIFVMLSHGEVAVSRADQKISKEDVARALSAARTFPLPHNREILDVFIKSFSVDSEKNIKEVIGMQGVKLEVDILAMGAFSPYYNNLISAVSSAGLKAEEGDIAPSALASAEAVLSLKEKEEGVAVLDIGGGASDLAVFEERDLIHLFVAPIGSCHITQDIALGLKIDMETAERIKREFGSCAPVHSSGSSKKQKQKIEIGEGAEKLVFSPKILATIIEARVEEIFEQVEKELKKISRGGLLPGGIVLVGGGSKLPGIVEFAKKKLKLPSKLGRIKEGFAGLQSDPSLATVCGLVLAGLEGEEETGHSPVKSAFSRVKKLFRIFIP